MKEVSHYGSLFFNNYHFNTNFHLQYVDFDTCWPAIRNIPARKLSSEWTRVKRSQIFHTTVPTSCFNTAHWSTQPSFRFTAEPLFTLDSLQTVARVQNVQRIYTVNKFTPLHRKKKMFEPLWAKTSQPCYLKHGGKTWTNIALKSTQQTDTTSAARGPRKWNTITP